MCRRATGGPFAVLSWVDATAVVWEGTKQPKARRSSPIATRSFCGDCGTPIALQYDDDRISSRSMRVRLIRRKKYHQPTIIMRKADYIGSGAVKSCQPTLLRKSGNSVPIEKR
ncbi:GFA family protein [Phyllobacterium sp. SYP-B3895]|uniref:GFA family protein n=1 Tax=Phyllobacterium sp. SYP-B3895 TaxID=2663240 RepID=UPI001FED6BB8|nr:GFA family protein [Phyllobacterium sp. SYP-B3895]